MELIEIKQAEGHPLDRAEKEKRLASYGEKFRKQELKAVPLLTWYIAQKKRPYAVRLYAAAFLGLIKERSAFGDLKERVLDKEEEPGMRVMALSSLGSLDAPPASLRNVLDKAADKSSPPELKREAYSQLAQIGTGDVKGALRAAKENGPSPTDPREAAYADFAVDAVSRARSAEAEDALFDLLRFFKKESPLRLRVLTGLSRQRLLYPEGNKRKKLSLDRLNLLTSVLFDDNPPAALSAARLLGGLGDARAVLPMIRRLKSAQDPALITELAQSLSAIGDARGGSAVSALADGLIKDTRFAPTRQRPDIHEYAHRIQEAARTSRPHETETAVSNSALGFRYEGWPGAGTPKLAWNGDKHSLLLRERPENTAPLTASLKLKAHMELNYDESVVVTVSPGRAHARRAVELSVREFGPVVSLLRARHEGPAPVATIRLREGDQIEILSYRADGECFLRKDSRVYLGECPQDDRTRFLLLAPFNAQWWLHVRIKNDAGWFNTNQDGLDFLPRH
jgi:HEAT repeat protein